MVGNRNNYLPIQDSEFMFEHFLRIVDGTGIFNPNMPFYGKMPINSGSGIMSMARSPLWGGCLASPSS